MSLNPSKQHQYKFKTWLVRFVKFNLVGTLVFLIATAIYSVSFNTFGFYTWLIANSIGAVLQFSLIALLNRTRKGKIFDTCQQTSSNQESGSVQSGETT